MKNLSYAVDILVFFVMLYVFDTSWLMAFIVSALVGAVIRTIFAGPDTPTITPTETKPEGVATGQAESVD